MLKSKSRKRKSPKRILALRDLEHAKTAVLNSLTSASGQRTDDHAIRELPSPNSQIARLGVGSGKLGVDAFFRYSLTGGY